MNLVSSIPEDARFSGIWTFRHKARLEIPARNAAVSFDGVMRLDAERRHIRVTALAGIGLRLFDMEVEPDSMRVFYLHPSLRKIPRVTEHIAESIRRIWFDCLPRMPHITFLSEYTSGLGWNITFERGESAGRDNAPDDASGADSGDASSGASGEVLWPETTRLADKRAGYALTVRLLRAHREDTP